MSEYFMNMQRQRQQRMRRAAAPTPSPNASFNGRMTATTTATEAEADANYNATAGQEEAAEEDDDPLANILSLKLKKPKHWKWELTTSRSCTNIALPRILLYDHTGELLVDADNLTEQIYRQPETPPESEAKTTEQQQQQQQERRRRSTTRKRAATSLLTPSIRQALDNEFNGLRIEDATPTTTTTPTHSLTPTRTSRTSSLQRLSPITSIHGGASGGSGSCIDFYTNELPDDDQRCSRRSSSLKGVRFNVDNDSSEKLSNNGRYYNAPNYPTPPSTVTTTTTGTTPTNSSSSGPREKRRYRRSHSSSGRSPAHSESILERFSYNKGRFSSPEYAVEQEVHHAPRYFLRTSKAGTLVIQEESFSRQRHRRRRTKNSSSENILGDGTPKSQSTSSLAKGHQILAPVRMLAATAPVAQQAQSLQNIAELQQMRRQKKTHTVRRYRSDGNVLMQRDLATSEEELEEAAMLQRQRQRQPRPRSLSNAQQQQRQQQQQQQPLNYSKDYKRELVTIDPDNRVYRAGQAPTAR